MVDESLVKSIEEAKASGKKVGLVQGSWDLFHLGHLKYILKARELCDFLIIAMDSDEKIKKRKGSNRPVIPENERYDFLKLLGMADKVVIKAVDEAKWELIRTVQPDVLIAIKENYSDEQIVKLKEFCAEVAILPRQSESSTSDKFRKLAMGINKIDDLDNRLNKTIEEMKKRIGYDSSMMEPIPSMIDYLKFSTDWVCPVVAACYYDGRWYYGTNQSDFNIPKFDVLNRTELYYATCEHAEMNLLKKLGDVEVLDTPIYSTLFPCDKCMKVLINKGVKKIYYLEDHPERNWSKRSHELAIKYGVETINLLDSKEEKVEQNYGAEDFSKYKYVYPPNAREQEQLDIMINQEKNGIDPFAPDVIDQEVLFETDNWYVTRNRFPYEGIEHQFLVIALNPVYKLENMSMEMWNELANIWLKLGVDYNIPGGALCFRFGEPALSGASLKRLHAHLIVPKEDEKTKFTIGGRRELKKGLYINPQTLPKV